MPELAVPRPAELSAFRRSVSDGPWRRYVILAGFALVWELYARWLDNALLLPTLVETLQAR